MGAIISPDSPYAREMATWNKPYVFKQYPRMVYRARRSERTRKPTVIDPFDENWSMGNCLTVSDEDQFNRAVKDGYRATQAEAIDLFESDLDGLAEAAAQRVHSEQRMSEVAQREAAAVQAEAPHKHLGEIPEAPRRRGRPPKVKAEENPH